MARPVPAAELRTRADQALTFSQEAQKFSVCPKIHAEDHIFKFLSTSAYFTTSEAAVDYYFNDGSLSCHKFTSLVRDHLTVDHAADVLEFASGYGMVTRHLAKQPNVNLWSCDIHPAAVKFIAEEIGSRTVLSASIPEQLSLPQDFDVVFALSFFSHMPITTWRRWLLRLTQAVRPNGLVIFTTHGSLCREAAGNPELSAEGFWFAPQSEQKDLPGDDYGCTITSEAFVRNNIAAIPHVELIDWKEGFWWGRQDTFILRKHR